MRRKHERSKQRSHVDPLAANLIALGLIGIAITIIGFIIVLTRKG